MCVVADFDVVVEYGDVGGDCDRAAVEDDQFSLADRQTSAPGDESSPVADESGNVIESRFYLNFYLKRHNILKERVTKGGRMSPQKLHKKIRLLTGGLVFFIACTIAQSYELYLQAEKRQVQPGIEVPAQEASQPAPAGKEDIPQMRTDAPPYVPIKPSTEGEPPLALRNKNPLNIKAMPKGRKWEGQIGRDEFGHAVFASWEHGLRAASLTLRTYAREHKIDTVETLLRRFCTAQGQTFENYVAFVCRSLGVKRDEKIDLITRMPILLRAMAKFESGMDLPEELFVSYDVLARL